MHVVFTGQVTVSIKGMSGDSHMTWMRVLLSLQEGKFTRSELAFLSIEVTLLWNVSISDLRYHLIVLRQTFCLIWFSLTMHFTRYQVSSYLSLCLRWSKALIKSWSIYSKLLKTYPEVTTLNEMSALENNSIPGLFPICGSLPKEWQGSKHLPLIQVSCPWPMTHFLTCSFTWLRITDPSHQECITFTDKLDWTIYKIDELANKKLGEAIDT